MEVNFEKLLLNPRLGHTGYPLWKLGRNPLCDLTSSLSFNLPWDFGLPSVSTLYCKSLKQVFVYFIRRFVFIQFPVSNSICFPKGFDSFDWGLNFEKHLIPCLESVKISWINCWLSVSECPFYFGRPLKKLPLSAIGLVEETQGSNLNLVNVG